MTEIKPCPVTSDEAAKAADRLMQIIPHTHDQYEALRVAEKVLLWRTFEYRPAPENDKYIDGVKYAIYEIMKEADIPGSQEIRDSGGTDDGMCAKAAEKIRAEFSAAPEESENFIQTKFGWCFYSLGSCPLIYNLYVHPQYRRCRHSKELLGLVISEIRKSGYEREIYIQARPKEDSISLADLTKYYKSMGLVVYEPTP